MSEDDNAIKKVLGLAGSVYLGIVHLARWHRLLLKGKLMHEKGFFLLSCSSSTNSQLPHVSALRTS